MDLIHGVKAVSKTAFHFQLKEFVGGSDFDRNAVDEILRVNNGKAVNVLIDSFGGNPATGLFISTAFKHHGEVNVHFEGLLILSLDQNSLVIHFQGEPDEEIMYFRRNQGK